MCGPSFLPPELNTLWGLPEQQAAGCSLRQISWFRAWLEFESSSIACQPHDLGLLLRAELSHLG